MTVVVNYSTEKVRFAARQFQEQSHRKFFSREIIGGCMSRLQSTKDITASKTFFSNKASDTIESLKASESSPDSKRCNVYKLSYEIDMPLSMVKLTTPQWSTAL